MKGLAVSVPSQEEVGEWAKTLAAIGGVLGAIWAVLSKGWRAWRKRAQMQRLESKAIRYLLDAQRHTLYFVTPTRESRRVSVDELARQKALVDEVRDELWMADGHESERERQRMAEDVAAVITRTQAIRRKQDMFKEGEEE